MRQTAVGVLTDNTKTTKENIDACYQDSQLPPESVDLVRCMLNRFEGTYDRYPSMPLKNLRHFVENYICRKCPHAQTLTLNLEVVGSKCGSIG